MLIQQAGEREREKLGALGLPPCCRDRGRGYLPEYMGYRWRKRDGAGECFEVAEHVFWTREQRETSSEKSNKAEGPVL